MRRLAAVGPVLAEPVDSSQLRRLSVAQVGSRFRAFVRALGPRVAIWEVGNEVNGSWTGAPRAVADKVRAAYERVRAADGRTAVTLYENEGCGDGPGELSPAAWARRYLPRRIPGRPRLRAALPLRGAVRRKATVGRDVAGTLHGAPSPLPPSRGRVRRDRHAAAGTPRHPPAARSIIDRYYRLRLHLSYYVGGGSYWYFAEDMVPWRTSPLWSALADAWRAPRRQARRDSSSA